MPNTEYLTESAEHWEALAAEALRMAEWDDAHVGSGAPSRHRAETYKRAAEAIRRLARWVCATDFRSCSPPSPVASSGGAPGPKENAMRHPGNARDGVG